MDADGSNPVQVSPSGGQDQLFPTWSPDGSKIAFSWTGDIFSVPATGGTAVNLTNDGFLDTEPACRRAPSAAATAR